MDKAIQGQYRFSHRLKGDVSLSLFDKYYLRVKEKKLKKAREFKLELAILNPKPIHVHDSTFHWLAAAIIVGLADLYFMYYLVTAGGENLMATLLAIAGATLLVAVFSVLFLYTSERKWVLETRASLYPLVEVPYRKKDSEVAAQFVQQLQAAIEQNVEKKGYSADTLFAGEMRMLRRLAKHKVLSIDTYDKAKKHMLEGSGQIRAA